MGVREKTGLWERWRMGVKDLRRRMILAPTPRERERWYAILLLAQGLTAAATAEALERDPHTIGRWALAFAEGGPAALIFEQTGGSPPPLTRRQPEELKAAGAATACGGGHRTGQLVLEGGAAVYMGRVRRQLEPEQLPELAAPLGIRFETPQETSGQG